ncbi:MAG: methyltransferase domain-containing protein [Actinomycetota bacterium]
MRVRLSRPVRIENGQGPPRYPVKEALGSTRTLIFKGDRVMCSCCGLSFRHFLFSPYGSARCPRCLSFERYRLLCRWLSDETDFGRGRAVRALDIAPTWAFQEFCRSFPLVDYLSVDIASPMAMRHMDIRGLDLPSGEFDWLFCYHVLEHVDDDEKALSEMFRVLKPGGTAVISVPIRCDVTVERSELTRQEAEEILTYDDHIRGYGLDFGSLLERAGFGVEVIPYTDRFSEAEVERLGLDVTEDLYISRKPAGHPAS